MEKVQDDAHKCDRCKQDQMLIQSLLSPTPAAKAIPFKLNTTKFLVPTVGKIFYTDGYSSMKYDDQYERTMFNEEMEVPSIGTDQENFEIAETITFDISAASTTLPLMCKTIIYKQGATHEREPPVLVRDACTQWDGIDYPRRNSFDSSSLSKTKKRNENGLGRARSNENLLNDSTASFSIVENTLDDANRCSSLISCTNLDDSTMSMTTPNDAAKRHISHLLSRYKHLRQMDENIVGRYEFYSVPFYQYRGHHHSQNDAETQANESDLNVSQNDTDDVNQARYSVTMVIPVKDRGDDTWNNYSNLWKLFSANIPTDTPGNHTTVGYIYTKPLISIQRTIEGRVPTA